MSAFLRVYPTKSLICNLLSTAALHSFIFTFSFLISLVPPPLHFYFFIFHFLGVPLAASGFGSGYPLLLAAYKWLVLSLSSSLSVIRNS